MNMKAKDVYGRINFYSTVLLPLEEAHKVQAILAKYGQSLDQVYRTDAPTINFLREGTVPSVEVVRELPVLDANGLTDRQVRDWTTAVSTSTGDEYLTPQEFANMRDK